MTSNRNTQVDGASPARNGRGAKVPTVQVYTIADVPPLSAEDRAALAAFKERQRGLRDVVRGCIHGNLTGAHIDGPAGVGKSYTVYTTLREEKADWRQHQRITAKPLYFELAKSPGAIHVVDDNEQLFAERSALTLIRSATGGEKVNGRRMRRVSYSISGSHAREIHHYFYGALIFIANRPLGDEKEEIRAVLSRIPSMNFAPTDREIKALMRQVARQGHAGESGSISPMECVEIIEYVIGLAGELQCGLDLRWIDHAYGYYLTNATGGGTTDWRDMVANHMTRTMTCSSHTPENSEKSAAETQAQLAKEVAMVQELERTPGLTQAQRIQRFVDEAKKSRATYYRHRNSTAS